VHQFLPQGEAQAPDPDTRLFLAARSGDARAFATLVRGLAAPSLALATRVLGHVAPAEDAVQEALTNLWRTADRFDPERGMFAAWWRRILMNAALDGRRRLRVVEPLDAAGDPADPAPGPVELAEAADLDKAVAAIMATLPPRQRAAMALFHGQGLSMIEIAEALDTSAKAVEGLLDRGRAALRDRLNHSFPHGHER
jgi:RNA polymerase sigma-70 factor (ECF subfamily)